MDMTKTDPKASMTSRSHKPTKAVARNGITRFRPMKPRDPGDPKEAVVRLFNACGGVPAVRRILGTGQTMTYAFTDPAADDEISFARVCALESARRTGVAAAYLAQLAGGIYVPAPPSDAEGELPACLATLGKELADVFAAGAEALADGVCDRREARKLLREAMEASDALGQLIATLHEIANGDPEGEA